MTAAAPKSLPESNRNWKLICDAGRNKSGHRVVRVICTLCHEERPKPMRVSEYVLGITGCCLKCSTKRAHRRGYGVVRNAHPTPRKEVP